MTDGWLRDPQQLGLSDFIKSFSPLAAMYVLWLITAEGMRKARMHYSNQAAICAMKMQ